MHNVYVNGNKVLKIQAWIIMLSEEGCVCGEQSGQEHGCLGFLQKPTVQAYILPKSSISMVGG